MICSAFDGEDVAELESSQSGHTDEGAMDRMREARAEHSMPAKLRRS